MRQKQSLLLVVFVPCIAALLLALAACGTEPQAALQQDKQAFINQLRAKGAAVVEMGSTRELPLSGMGYLLKVNGERVEVYTYASANDATTDAARISSDGTTFKDRIVTDFDWISIPHFYKKDQLIVFYVGTNADITNLLEGILGPQFAGG